MLTVDVAAAGSSLRGESSSPFFNAAMFSSYFVGCSLESAFAGESSSVFVTGAPPRLASGETGGGGVGAGGGAVAIEVVATGGGGGDGGGGGFGMLAGMLLVVMRKSS